MSATAAPGTPRRGAAPPADHRGPGSTPVDDLGPPPPAAPAPRALQTLSPGNSNTERTYYKDIGADIFDPRPEDLLQARPPLDAARAKPKTNPQPKPKPKRKAQKQKTSGRPPFPLAAHGAFGAFCLERAGKVYRGSSATCGQANALRQQFNALGKEEKVKFRQSQEAADDKARSEREVREWQARTEKMTFQVDRRSAVEELKAAMATKGVDTVGKAAALIGMDYGNLCKWIKNVYAGNVEKVTEKVLDWARGTTVKMPGAGDKAALAGRGRTGMPLAERRTVRLMSSNSTGVVPFSSGLERNWRQQEPNLSAAVPESDDRRHPLLPGGGAALQARWEQVQNKTKTRDEYHELKHWFRAGKKRAREARAEAKALAKRVRQRQGQPHEGVAGFVADLQMNIWD